MSSSPLYLGCELKITIVGAGNIGSTAAFLLSERGLCDELVLIDVLRDRVSGTALDLGHCRAWQGGVDVIGTTDYAASKGSDLAIITAGTPRAPGESRLDLAKRNSEIAKGVVQNLMKHMDGLYLVVANPVDILTHIALKESDKEPREVFGLGTMLDTLRLRSLMPKDMDSSKVWVVGEHGDSMVPVFSRLGGDRKKFLKFFEEVRYGAAQVIKMRGYTAFAPAVAIAEVVEAIAGDMNEIMPLSVYHQEHDLCIGALAKVNKGGAERAEMELDDEEKKEFAKSMEVVEWALKGLGYHR